MHIMNKLKSKKGFTLIELIVVMAVIAILVLLAAPRFLGYTKDAQVTAMKADAKMLSNVALVYNVENEAWPVKDSEATNTDDAITPIDATGFDAALTTLLNGADLYVIDEAKVSKEYKSLKNSLSEYGIVTEGPLEGSVFHIGGVEGRDGAVYFTNN